MQDVTKSFRVKFPEGIAKMQRFTMLVRLNDYRPHVDAVVYPYWCVGQTATANEVVAYAQNEEELKAMWPELTSGDRNYRITSCEEVECYTFGHQFPAPYWWLHRLFNAGKLISTPMTQLEAYMKLLMEGMVLPNNYSPSN